jgi:acetyltransferase-like isoleucine patch superfamily enzyme
MQIVMAVLRRLRTRLATFRAGRILRHGKDLHIGARSRIWAPNGIRMGDGVYIGKDVHIEANCEIGNYCLIANRVAIVGRNDHDFRAVGVPVRYAPWIGHQEDAGRSIVRIGDDVWIGFGAIVLTGASIGKGCVVAAGSVVVSEIPPYSIVAGVPAKVIGSRFDNASIERHELGIRGGVFRLSERGYGSCVIQPARLD